MRKLLFLLCCASLLLLATAAPALAAYFYQVGPDGSVIWVDESTMTWGNARSVPQGADVRVGFSLLAITQGGAISQAKDWLSRLEVRRAGPGPGSLIAKVDESSCQLYWGVPYHWNDWTTGHPELVTTPWNGSQAGVWGIDWLVPMPTLAKGTYSVTYSSKLSHTIADPLFAHPWEYQLAYPWDWTSEPTVTFMVK